MSEENIKAASDELKRLVDELPLFKESLYTSIGGTRELNIVLRERANGKVVALFADHSMAELMTRIASLVARL